MTASADREAGVDGICIPDVTVQRAFIEKRIREADIALNVAVV